MPGSLTPPAVWPGSRSLIGRAALSALGVLGGLHFVGQALVRPVVPTFRSIVVSLDDRFVITDARLAREGANQVVRFRANLAHPLVLGTRVLYPFGTHGVPEGGFQVTNTVGGVLQLPALLLIIVLAWPVGGTTELALRLGLALPVMAALLLLDAPFTAVAELRNGLVTMIDPRATDDWMVASRFLMGGGGYALTLLLAGGSVTFARGCFRGDGVPLRSPRWRTVTSREFDTFFRTYPRPLEVDPPFDRSARRHLLRDPTLGAGRAALVADCRRGNRQALYRIRVDLHEPVLTVPRPPEAERS